MTMIRTGKYLGKCKSRKSGVRVESPSFVFSTECKCGANVKVLEVIGYMEPEIKCGASCRNATGPSYDCSCGGANHGCNH